MGLGWFAFLIVGLLAGWIAEKVMEKNHGLLKNLVVGVLGAYLGAWLFSLVGISEPTSLFGALVVAIIGAVVLLWIVGKLFGRS